MGNSPEHPAAPPPGAAEWGFVAELGQAAAEAYFSQGYAEARGKFRAAAQAAGAELTALDVGGPSGAGSIGGGGGEYTIDIAVLRGSSPKGLLVHSSGVHGVEGYAGSAVQVAALHGLVGKPPPVTCVFVHAVNPYGMAHFRRFNENNVDLNRNAIPDEEWSNVLERDPNIARYEDFYPLFAPDAAPTGYYVCFGMWGQMAYSLARFGFLNLKRALVVGTYSREEGLFYGGRELQRSHRLLRAFLQKHFGKTPASEVMWVDVHTGLGPCGQDVLLVDQSIKDAARETFPDAPEIQVCGENSGGGQAAGYELSTGIVGGLELPRLDVVKIQSIAGDVVETEKDHPFGTGDKVTFHHGDGASLLHGVLGPVQDEQVFYVRRSGALTLTLHNDRDSALVGSAQVVQLEGGAGAELWRSSSIPSFYSRLFDPSKGRPFIFTQEFGTLPGVLVARAMIIENAGYHHDFANHERWRAWTRSAFYVQTAAWKRSIVSRGLKVFQQLVARGASLETGDSTSTALTV